VVLELLMETTFWVLVAVIVLFAVGSNLDYLNKRVKEIERRLEARELLK
jgi:uncharacterized membrane protein